MASEAMTIANPTQKKRESLYKTQKIELPNKNKMAVMFRHISVISLTIFSNFPKFFHPPH